MKLLVTGATGYIGSAVAAALARAGHDVVGLASTTSAAHRIVAAALPVVLGDLRRPETVAAAGRDADGVVWCATTGDGEVDREAIDATLAALAGQPRMFVYTSGVWVHGDTGGEVATEEAPLHPPALVAWRPAAERAVLDTPVIRSIVIRPGIVYGGGGGLPAMLVDLGRRDGAVPVIGGGDNRWPVVHREDLADLYVRAVDRAPARTVLIAAHRAATQRDVCRAASRAAGSGAITSWTLDEARAAFGPLADALALDQLVSSARAVGLLDWRPRAADIVEDLERGSYARSRR